MQNTFKFTYIIRLAFLLVFWPFKFNNYFAFRTRWSAIICHICIRNRNRSYFPLPPYCLAKIIDIILAVSRSPTFGLRSSYAIGPERHVMAEGYMTRKLNFCLEPTLTLILTLRPSRRVS